jgi:hypothetical protein
VPVPQLRHWQPPRPRAAHRGCDYPHQQDRRTRARRWGSRADGAAPTAHGGAARRVKAARSGGPGRCRGPWVGGGGVAEGRGALVPAPSRPEAEGRPPRTANAGSRRRARIAARQPERRRQRGDEVHAQRVRCAGLERAAPWRGRPGPAESAQRATAAPLPGRGRERGREVPGRRVQVACATWMGWHWRPVKKDA